MGWEIREGGDYLRNSLEYSMKPNGIVLIVSLKKVVQLQCKIFKYFISKVKEILLLSRGK